MHAHIFLVRCNERIEPRPVAELEHNSRRGLDLKENKIHKEEGANLWFNTC